MPLVSTVITLIIIGVVLWLINNFIPMQSTIKSIMNILVVVVVLVWLLHGFGIIPGGGDINVPTVK